MPYHCINGVYVHPKSGEYFHSRHVSLLSPSYFDTVVSGSSRVCHPQNPLVVNASSPGFLASVVTDETGLGTNSCPWTLRVSPGQKINLTLMDFSINRHLKNRDPTLRPVYLTIMVSAMVEVAA